MFKEKTTKRILEGNLIKFYISRQADYEYFSKRTGFNLQKEKTICFRRADDRRLYEIVNYKRVNEISDSHYFSLIIDTYLGDRLSFDFLQEFIFKENLIFLVLRSSENRLKDYLTENGYVNWSNIELARESSFLGSSITRTEYDVFILEKRESYFSEFIKNTELTEDNIFLKKECRSLSKDLKQTTSELTKELKQAEKARVSVLEKYNKTRKLLSNTNQKLNNIENHLSYTTGKIVVESFNFRKFFKIPYLLLINLKEFRSIKKTNSSKVSSPKINNLNAVIEASKLIDTEFDKSINLLRAKSIDSHIQSIFEANNFINQSDYKSWLEKFNAYLSVFNIAPISLDDSTNTSNIFDSLSCDKELRQVNEKDLVSVIFTTFNSEETIEYSIRSILQQTYTNIELVIVDDASDDNTVSIVERLLSESSTPFKIIVNSKNMGTYFSKNTGLKKCAGDYITCQDSDDWSHPQRIENHLNFMKLNNLEVSPSYILRLSSNGKVSRFMRNGSTSFDGIARIGPINTIFSRNAFNYLGFWDDVRFGADSEIDSRSKILFKHQYKEFRSIVSLCLENPKGLTGDSVTGVSIETGISPARMYYRNQWSIWQNESDNLYINFPHMPRMFDSHISQLN